MCTSWDFSATHSAGGMRAGEGAVRNFAEPVTASGRARANRDRCVASTLTPFGMFCAHRHPLHGFHGQFGVPRHPRDAAAPIFTRTARVRPMMKSPDGDAHDAAPLGMPRSMWKQELAAEGAARAYMAWSPLRYPRKSPSWRSCATSSSCSIDS